MLRWCEMPVISRFFSCLTDCCICSVDQGSDILDPDPSDDNWS